MNRPAAMTSTTGPISLARKMEVCTAAVLSLRRHDPDQVQRVTAIKRYARYLSPLRGTPRNGANVGACARVSTPRPNRHCEPKAKQSRTAAPHLDCFVA